MPPARGRPSSERARRSAQARQLLLVATVDHAAPVVELQRKLALLHRARLLTQLWLGLPMWMLWVVATVVGARWLFGLDLYAASSGWVNLSLGVGALGMVLTLWLPWRFSHTPRGARRAARCAPCRTPPRFLPASRSACSSDRTRTRWWPFPAARCGCTVRCSLRSSRCRRDKKEEILKANKIIGSLPIDRNVDIRGGFAPQKIRFPSRSGGCFIKGTLVHTREGLRPIEELREGDYVLSSPEDGSGEKAYKRVMRTIVHERKAIRQVIGDWGEVGRFEMVAATGNHPFWVEGIGWTRADLLDRKSVLRLVDGRAGGVVDQYPVYRTEEPGVGWAQEMADVATSHGNRYDYENGKVLPMGGFEDVLSEEVLNSDDPFLAVTVYNIEVEDWHTYYVGKTGFWVHNDDCVGILPFRA